MNNYKEYNKKTLKHLQKVELMILKDFIKICDENNLNYFLYGGTLLGAIRHKGFIPWDDDLDVIMFRKDYEKFLKIMENNEINEKYEIINTKYDDYFFNFNKMSLKNTLFNEYWYDQVKFKMGIHIDIFALDNLPNNKIKRYLFMQKCFITDRLFSMSAIKIKDKKEYIKVISSFINSILNKLNLTPKYFQRKTDKLFKKYNNKKTSHISDLTANKPLNFKMNDFLPAKTCNFENTTVKIPNKYDKILTLLYGNYMKIPPKEKRVNHQAYKLKFGDY